MSTAPLAGVFVTGTDTGVGKTTVGCAILRGLRARGRALTPYKPVETAWSSPKGTDAWRLAGASHGVTPDEVCPVRLRLPASPRRAARDEGVALSLDARLAHALALAARGDPLLVEGAGGLLVPLTATETFADLARALGLPALVVARDALGTINHTLLTVEALQRRGIALVGVALNAASGVDATALDNARELQALLGDVRVFGPLPWGDDRALDEAVAACGLLDAAWSAARAA